MLLLLGAFSCFSLVFAAKNPVPDSGSQPRAVRLVVEPNGDVSGTQVEKEEAAESKERKVQKKQKHAESLDTEKPLNPTKVEKIDAALRAEPDTKLSAKKHAIHDSGPHPAPPQKGPMDVPTPDQWDTDPTYCWGDGGLKTWTIVTQYKEGELSAGYEAGLRKNRRTYAKKWKYEYCEFKLETIPGKEGWDKVAVVSSLLRRRRGKILYLDTDSVIMNMDISLESIEKKYRKDKDLLVVTDHFEPRGQVDILNSSLTTGVMMVWNHVWATNFFRRWLLLLQDDKYMAQNFSVAGWNEQYHGAFGKEQTGLLMLRYNAPVDWDINAQVVPWDVLGSPVPPPVDQGKYKWGSDPTWRYQPGDFILHPHGRNGAQQAIYRSLFGVRHSCVLTGEREFPCQESTDKKQTFELSFPRYLGMTTEEWTAHAGKAADIGKNYGIPVVGGIVVVGGLVHWYLRRKDAVPRT